jgi:hypothetical protein
MAMFSGGMDRVLGKKANTGSLMRRREDDIVEFLVTAHKAQNFLKHCNEVKPVDNPHSVIKQYTEHTTELYLKVNLALAADSEALEDHGDYITDLRNSVLSQPLLDDGLLYRGVDLSPAEIEQMERLGSFYIPSFSSTSVDSKKAYSKNSTLIFHVPYGCLYACSVTQALSRYYDQEREVLLNCYSAFRLQRVEKDGNNSMISLYLDEQLSSLDRFSPNC